jgi:hypothetical protein
MLRLFSVEPRTLRIKPKGQPNSTAKGYLRDHLEAAKMVIQGEAHEETEQAYIDNKGPWIDVRNRLESANGDCETS